MQNFDNTTKPETFVNDISNLNITKPQESRMPSQESIQNSRSTGGQGANKRYKRSPEELMMDIAKVDELVASGKFNQIEALNHVGLQSSVYHYKKRLIKEPVAKSDKPRKFAPRPSRATNASEVSAQRKQLMNSLKAEPKNSQTYVKETAPKNNEVDTLKARIRELEHKYNKLQKVVEILTKD